MPTPKDLSLANRLVAFLPSRKRSFFIEHSELVELKPSVVLGRAGHATPHAYFPVDSFVSLSLPMAGAPDAGYTLVGNEGMFSASTALGMADATFTCTVQGAGRALRIRERELKRLLLDDACLRELMQHYVHVCLGQLALQAACVSLHTTEQRLARWLLMTRDRADSTELFLTQETLALMLGVRRESITRAAGALQRHGLISYGRGYLMLLDEPGLLTTACPCYRADLDLYEQAFAAPPHACHTPKPASRNAMPNSTSMSRAAS